MPARLKSLELQGYKTFANRTYFEFGQTITAIVGPNGSGKSNIADSLRWVLGEQSYSLLRARKSEDMIYSGSEIRSRSGLASATITFDNSDSWLPIDFSEVSVTRRASRDGQNEYLINGQRVRLRDVAELLSASGLAERTYTVIGQGLVDAALSLRADERRRLFEEAAGIGLHRSRREESIRRLEQTRRNMERVEDILAELKPRLNSLERQARRAREYELVRTDLQALLREWYGFHWHQSQKDLSLASAHAQQQESRLEKSRVELEKVDSGLNNLREKIQSLRENINIWHKALSQHHAQREDTIRKLAIVDERKRSLQAQLQDDQDTLVNLELEQGFAEEQLAAADAELKRLADELAEAEQQAEKAEKEYTEKQSKRKAIENEIGSMHLEISNLNSQQGKFEAQLIEGKDQTIRLQEQIEMEESRLKEAETNLVRCKEEYSAAQGALREAERAYQQIDASFSEQMLKTREMETRISKTQQQRSRLLEEQARQKAQIDVLVQAEEALVGYASGTRLLLQAARDGRLRGARGAVNAFLEVPAQFEKAVSAALGVLLDAVLLDSEPDAAMDLLDIESARAVLLPISDLKVETRPDHIKTTEGIIGEALDLVQSNPEMDPIIRLLLNKVVIVQDRAAARRFLTDDMRGWRAVTLRGEVFHSDGVIYSGGLEENHSILGRERRIRELGQENKRLEAKIIDNQDLLTDLQTELADQKTKLKKLEIERENAQQKLAREARTLEQVSAQQAKLQREIQWAHDHLQGLQKESRQRSESIASINNLLATQLEKLAALRKLLIQRENDLNLISLDQDQVQQAHWATRLAVTHQSLQDAQARSEERKASLVRLQQARSAMLERINKNTESLSEMEITSQEAAIAENEVALQIQELNQKITPTELELISLEQQQAAEQARVNAARKQVSITEHVFSQARVDLTRKQEGLNALQRRIEDDFGLVNYEYAEQVSVQTPLPLRGMVEQLPVVRKLPPELDENIRRQRAQLRRMGSVNPDAQAEFEEVRQRFEFLTEQMVDLHQAEQDIRMVIQELDSLMEREFQKTFDEVAGEFRQIFTRLFGGGSARLVLTDPDDLTNTGIEIEARLPGRRTQGLALLSGGERSLTATSLVFALLKVSPTPFCVLDEVDAMLDDANVGRFSELLSELSRQTQFLIVSHNRNTIQAAEVIYGVTMGKDSSSQVLSLKLDEVGKVIN